MSDAIKTAGKRYTEVIKGTKNTKADRKTRRESFKAYNEVIKKDKADAKAAVKLAKQGERSSVG